MGKDAFSSSGILVHIGRTRVHKGGFGCVSFSNWSSRKICKGISKSKIVAHFLGKRTFGQNSNSDDSTVECRTVMSQGVELTMIPVDGNPGMEIFLRLLLREFRLPRDFGCQSDQVNRCRVSSKTTSSLVLRRSWITDL